MKAFLCPPFLAAAVINGFVTKAQWANGVTAELVSNWTWSRNGNGSMPVSTRDPLTTVGYTWHFEPSENSSQGLGCATRDTVHASAAPVPPTYLPRLVSCLRRQGGLIINYAIDDRLCTRFPLTVYEVAPATRPLPLPHFPHPVRPMPPPRSAFGLELSPAAIRSGKSFTGHSRCLLENGVEEPSRPLSPTSPRNIINRCGASTRRSLTSSTSRSSANRRTATSEATAPFFRLRTIVVVCIKESCIQRNTFFGPIVR